MARCAVGRLAGRMRLGAHPALAGALRVRPKPILSMTVDEHDIDAGQDDELPSVETTMRFLVLATGTARMKRWSPRVPGADAMACAACPSAMPGRSGTPPRCVPRSNTFTGHCGDSKQWTVRLAAPLTAQTAPDGVRRQQQWRIRAWLTTTHDTDDTRRSGTAHALGYIPTG